ncbi:aminoglycoside phosphotransferase family protein [Marinobacter sp. F3R08]|uniref:aminoglycoside phosphotransferase family protein n=1 Tax=Marinobacter sp. F3R08 TaxID=2841559 RepID=UPI001C0A44B0|nr:phosphotransferase [Marinobacter sp. F3R08]MBU2953283.1 phosphotransferase [Marinobacter sp. F3R08]
MDTRLQLLTNWVRQFPGFEHCEAEPVSGDASFRRYFRVWQSDNQKDTPGERTPFIVMDAPPEHENCTSFVAIAQHWHRQGIAVPDVVQIDLDQGFLLLEDFGDQLMLARLNDESADQLYQNALEELILIARQPSPEDYPLPAYNATLLEREMALFPDWLLEQYLGMSLENSERALLETTFSMLRESALAQPEVTVHRDYHSRNLLVRPSHTRPGVIDFQDAVTGPITYDVVSLLKDCYVQWPEERICDWLNLFYDKSRDAGLHRADRETFRQWFELMGMQRHLKAAGIFARLSIRDGKHGYLNDIPRTVQYLIVASGRQPALRHFHEWLSNAVMPRIKERIGVPPDQELPQQ